MGRNVKSIVENAITATSVIGNPDTFEYGIVVRMRDGSREFFLETETSPDDWDRLTEVVHKSR